MELLAYLWLALLIVPSFFWYFLVKQFNKKTEARFPAILYSIIYLIPLGHFFLSWSFDKDLNEFRLKTGLHELSFFRTYLKLALPYLFLSIGAQLFVFCGVILLIFDYAVLGAIGDFLIDISIAVPFLSFLWLSWGFWTIYKNIGVR